jgi:hypothetical protein
MREIYDLRVPDEQASRYLPEDLGRKLSDFGGMGVRRIDIDRTDPWFDRIVAIDEELRAKDELFVSSWGVGRHYSAAEFAAAEAFYLRIHSTFEPCAEECGTVFDETTACPDCGAGRSQIGPLVLDLKRLGSGWDEHTRRVPAGKDIARTIAGEVVVSDRLASLLRDSGSTGYELGPVLQHRRRDEVRNDWHQLLVTGPTVRVLPPTVAGTSPSDLDADGTYKCPSGHVLGLNVLSELSLSRADWSGADHSQTREAFGHRVGMLVPEHPIIVSPRVAALITSSRVKGARLEVAHLVS